VAVNETAFHRWRAWTGAGVGQYYYLSGILSNLRNPPVNFVDQLNSPLVPCLSRFNSDWKEQMSDGEIRILGGLVRSRLVCRRSCSACSVM